MGRIPVASALFFLMAHVALADGRRPNDALYAVKSAHIKGGYFTVRTTWGHELVVDLHHLEVKLRGDLEGTYVLVEEKYVLETDYSKLVPRLFVFVRTNDLEKEWVRVIAERLRELEKPSDVPLTVIRE